MDTQTQTIELKAVQPPKPRQPAPSRPQVAVRPLATTTANVAALVGEGVWAVAGPVGLIAAAGAAVAVPAASVAMSRVRAKRAQSRSLRTSTTTRGGGLGLPKLPGGRSGLGSSSGRGASGTGRSAAGAGTGGSGRSLRSLLGGKPGTGSGSGATGRSGAGTPGSSRAGRSTGNGSKPSALRRMLDKLRGRGTSGPGSDGSTGASGGKSGKPMSARQARKVAKDLTKQLAAAQKPGRLARLLAWRKKRRAARKKAKTQAVQTARRNGTPTRGQGKVATQVRKPTATQAKTAGKAAAPKANPAPPVQRPNQPSSTATPTGVTMTASAMRAMLDIVEDMKRVANAYNPEGIEEVMAEYALWPEVLRELAGVWKIMAAKAQDEYPLKPAAADLVDAINTHQRAVANAAEQVAPTIRALHRDKFDDLDDPKQAMWDQSRNGRPARST